MAYAYNHYTLVIGAINILLAKQRSHTFYLHSILTEGEMKRAIIIIFVIVLLGAVLWQNNNNPGIIISRLAKKGNIGTGDLKYRINLFGIIPVAEATFANEKIEEYGGKKVYHLNASAGVLKIFSKLFNGYAVLDSYVDKEKLSPVLFKQKVKGLGHENPSKEISYDLEKGTMTLSGVVRQILPNTQDPLSAVFNLKRMDLSNARNIEMNINTNQKNYILEGTVKQQVMSINNKGYKVALVEAVIRRRDKDPYHRSNVTITFLKEKENIPVLIKVFASGALMTAELVEIKR